MTPFGPYALAGWCVLSDLELPELLCWPASQRGSLPLRIEAAESPSISGSPGFEPSANGGSRLRAGALALFEISASGDCVTVHQAPDADPLLVRAHLYGSVLAILCFQRGLLPLHGASVRIGKRAAVLSGPRGAGKSTLATALARRGYPLLSDDVSPVDLRDPRCPLVWPAFPRVKLLEDAIASFDLAGATAYTRVPQGTKGHFGMASPTLIEEVTRPVPLGGIFALDRKGDDMVSCTLVPRKAALAYLNSQTHRQGMGLRMGAQEQIFHQVYQIASSVPVRRLRRPVDLNRLDESAQQVEAAMADGSDDETV